MTAADSTSGAEFGTRGANGVTELVINVVTLGLPPGWPSGPGPSAVLRFLGVYPASVNATMIPSQP